MFDVDGDGALVQEQDAAMLLQLLQPPKDEELATLTENRKAWLRTINPRDAQAMTTRLKGPANVRGEQTIEQG